MYGSSEGTSQPTRRLLAVCGDTRREAIHLLADRRCRIREVSTGLTTDTWDQAALMFLRATKRKGMDSETAARVARLSSGRSLPDDRIEEARSDWMDEALAAREVAEMHKIAVSTLRRKLGRRPRGPGRPKRET